ncbi:hypothetical protein ACF8C6_12600 [Pseudomonas sp. zbq_18]|uniref:hypothetical protein n=1 Tax=Pseudomonadota TaxID=1224 RepID=UPI00370A933F
MSLPDHLTDHVDGDAQRAALARRERIERLRRGSVWFMAVMLLAMLIGLMIGRVVRDQIPWGGVMPMPEVISHPAVLAVDPVLDAHGLTLRLQLAQPVRFQRSEQGGAVIIRLEDVALNLATQAGRVQRGGRSLAWRVEAQGRDVQILLVGLGAALPVREDLQPAGEHWQLKVDVALPE